MVAHGGGSSVFEWPCCVLLTNTPWPWPTPARAASAGCGKSGQRPAGGQRERIPGAARSFFHRLARARSSVPQQGLVPSQGAERRKTRLLFLGLGEGALRREWTSPKIFSIYKSLVLRGEILFHNPRVLYRASEGGRRRSKSAASSCSRG